MALGGHPGTPAHTTCRPWAGSVPEALPLQQAGHRASGSVPSHLPSPTQSLLAPRSSDAAARASVSPSVKWETPVTATRKAKGHPPQTTKHRARCLGARRGFFLQRKVGGVPGLSPASRQAATPNFAEPGRGHAPEGHKPAARGPAQRPAVSCRDGDNASQHRPLFPPLCRVPERVPERALAYSSRRQQRPDASRTPSPTLCSK